MTVDEPPLMSAELKRAVWQGDVAEVATLLDAGESPNSVDDVTGWSCLMLSVENVEEEMLVFLLERGADPRYALPSGWTALHHAVDSECDGEQQTGIVADGSFIRVLMTAGADPTVAWNGQTALDMARGYCNPAVISALLESR